MTTISIEVDIDLFVTTLRGLWHCCALRLSATLGSAPQLNNLFVTTQRTAARRIAPRGRAPLRDATQLNDLFVIPQRHATPRIAPQLGSAHLNTTICLLLRSSTQLNAAQCNSSGLDAPRLIACLLNATN